MRKVLVTGASGFIGSHTLPLLVQRGFEVHAISRAPRSPSIGGHLLYWHQCNLLEMDDQNSLLSRVRPTHLLHFAWHTLPGDYPDSLENIRWIQASLELLLRFSNQGGRRAVFAGTCAEYDWTHGYCVESVTPEKPSSLYGASKYSLQTILRQFSKTTELSSAWGRIFHLYGPGEHPERLVPSVIVSLLSGKPAHCSNGEQIRDFLFVKDVASAFVQLLDSDIQGVVNIASGEPVPLKKIVGWLGDYLGCPKLIEFGSIPARVSEPRLLVASVERLTKELLWRPEYTLQKGLEQTVSWWKQALRKCSGAADGVNSMRICIDTKSQALEITKEGRQTTLGLYTREAFELISQVWLKVGWDQKYVYTFTWMGRPIIQLPEDMIRIQEVLYRVRPDVVIETGIAHGGSLIYYASLCKAMGKGRVIGIDIEIRKHNRIAIETHELFPYITLVEGNSTEETTVQTAKSLVNSKERVLVILDSNHSKKHVLRELDAYHDLVTRDSYIVATDGIMKELSDVPRGNSDWTCNNPAAAALEFSQNHPEFVMEQPPWPFNESGLNANVTHWPCAFLRRK